VRVGINSRLDTIQAAVLIPKLAVFEHDLNERQRVAGEYTRALNAIGIESTPHVEQHNVSAWAQYTVRVPERERIREHMKAAGIPTAVHYPLPLNKQPAVADESAKLPVGDRIAEEVLSLPMHPDLSSDEIAKVVSALGAALEISREI
jgi:UDP-2-acetamido-2-deoxy-ribo-hexuluronate aminotransferase